MSSISSSSVRLLALIVLLDRALARPGGGRLLQLNRPGTGARRLWCVKGGRVLRLAACAADFWAA